MAKEEALKKVELKVSVNCCEGCRRKVLKALSIKGVLKTEIHPTLPKISVTGNVDVSTLIKKLAKRGKSAELWPASESEKQDKEEKKSESTTNKAGNSIENEKAKVRNENPEKLPKSNEEENKSNARNAPKDYRAKTNDNKKEDISDNKNYEEKTVAEDGKSSYQTVVTAIPQMNYFVRVVNPNVMPPQIQGYYPMPAINNPYPVPYYTMNTYSAPPPYCCIHNSCHCQQPSYQSQQGTGFGDYFNDENTVGCHLM